MGDEMTKSSKEFASRKIILEPMTGKIVISEVDPLTHVVLSKAEKRVPYGEFSWYHKVYNVKEEMSHTPRSL
jgi:hypothetical protein